jgi:hypothetical protein
VVQLTRGGRTFLLYIHTEETGKILTNIFEMKMAVFWVVAQGIALMMEAARTSETMVNFYQTTRRYNPEDSHLQTHRRENLKSYLGNEFL